MTATTASQDQAEVEAPEDLAVIGVSNVRDVLAELFD